ncbi:hypothetical protein ACIPSA_13225 [Streptomyces sp. NPDC086549]|uniref:hypothetical protein n=1 Tax=Streptomyces sp. NPDC086549 TaxID=3365752 RepID=UPI00380F86C9
MAESDRAQSVLLKVGITGVLGIGSYVITNLFEASEVAKITLSLLIGASALMVQFMRDFEKGTKVLGTRLEEHASAVERRVTDGFVRFGDIFEFLGRLDDDTQRSAEVERLVRNVAALEPAPGGILKEFVDAELKRVADLMGQLGGAHVDYEGEDRNWLLTLVDRVEETMVAASTHEDLDFWKTDLGRRYLMAQRDAISHRGVSIRRLIIVESPDHIDHDLRKLREQQESMDIEVRIVSVSTLPQNLRIYPVHNFVVFDGAISYEVSPDLHGGRGTDAEPVNPMIASTKLVLMRRDVDKRIARFEELWGKGS